MTLRAMRKTTGATRREEKQVVWKSCGSRVEGKQQELQVVILAGSIQYMCVGPARQRSRQLGGTLETERRSGLYPLTRSSCAGCGLQASRLQAKTDIDSIMACQAVVATLGRLSCSLGRHADEEYCQNRKSCLKKSPTNFVHLMVMMLGVVAAGHYTTHIHLRGNRMVG